VIVGPGFVSDVPVVPHPLVNDPNRLTGTLAALAGTAARDTSPRAKATITSASPVLATFDILLFR
jgi:hypothetical protein